MGLKTMAGRGKYGITLTHKGRRKIVTKTFNTKAKAEEVLAKYLSKSKKRKGVKNPRVIKVRGYTTKCRI